MSRSSEPLGAVLISLSLLLLIIPWSLGGAYSPEEGAGDAHAGHGGPGEMLPGQFMAITLLFKENNWDADAGIVVAPDPGWMVMGGERMSMNPVYLAAAQWSYTPAAIQLEAGVEYQFRMMTMDVYHGASVNTDSGSQMVRLIPGVVIEQRLTFDEPGEYTLYCSYYCGEQHNGMSGKIVVV